MVPIGQHILVIAGPSGAGKTTLAHYLRDSYPERVALDISYTSRRRRVGETDGVDYHFVDRAYFEDNAHFLEVSEVFGERYGTNKADVFEKVMSGKDVVLIKDIQGVRRVRNTWPDAWCVMVCPSSLGTLRARMSGRNNIDQRIAEAQEELRTVSEGLFDFFVSTDSKSASAIDINTIYQAMRLKALRSASDNIPGGLHPETQEWAACLRQTRKAREAETQHIAKEAYARMRNPNGPRIGTDAA